MSQPVPPSFQPYPPPPPLPSQPKPARRIIWFSLTFVGGLVLGLAIARAPSTDGNAASSAPSTVTTVVTTKGAANVQAPAPSAVTKVVTKTVTPAPPEGIGDGTYTVPGEVKPGKYKTKGSDTEGIPCYWARLSGTSGDFNEILANGNPVGQTTITIKSGDKAFETNGCQDWVRVK